MTPVHGQKVPDRFCGYCGRQMVWDDDRNMYWWKKCPRWGALWLNSFHHDLDYTGLRVERPPRFDRSTGRRIR